MSDTPTQSTGEAPASTPTADATPATAEASAAPVESQTKTQSVDAEQDFDAENYQSYADETDPLPDGPAPTQAQAEREAAARARDAEDRAAPQEREQLLNTPPMREHFAQAAAPQQLEEGHEAREGEQGEERGEGQDANHDNGPDAEFDPPGYTW